MAIIANGDGEYVSSLLMADHFLPPDDQDNYPLMDFEWALVAPAEIDLNELVKWAYAPLDDNRPAVIVLHRHHGHVKPSLRGGAVARVFVVKRRSSAPQDVFDPA